MITFRVMNYQNFKNLKKPLKLLSVIVPMYNVEPYVERCIRSLENQDIEMDEYEIICINDGSPDKSKDVILELQKEFNNIVLINQENQGVSMARNNGIDRAIGKYLLMIDPDDFVEANCFSEKLRIIDEKNLDLGITGYIILDEKYQEEYRYDPNHIGGEVLSGIEYSYRYLRGNKEIRDPHRSVAIFYKTLFLKRNNLIYLKNVPYLEDGELIARIMCLAKRVLFINDLFYLRTTRPGSATHSNLARSKYAREGFIYAAINLSALKQQSLLSAEQKAFINQPIIHFVVLAIFSLRGNYLRYFSSTYKKLKSVGLKHVETEACSKSYTKMGKYYNISPHLLYVQRVFYLFRKSLINKFR